MTNDLLYQVALTLVPNIGDFHAKALVNRYGDAQSIFKAKKKDLEQMEGIGTVRANNIKAFTNFQSRVGVLAHGLDRIYRVRNKGLAKQMIEHGGLLTEFTSNTIPDKQNFPKRNRIVAGMCDALVVIESGKKGGSLITAELANNYNKDVFAIPGKTTDTKSEGCNYLIKQNKASLITSAADLVELMNWAPKENQ